MGRKGASSAGNVEGSLRQSSRHRTINTRLGTPPKIVQQIFKEKIRSVAKGKAIGTIPVNGDKKAAPLPIARRTVANKQSKLPSEIRDESVASIHSVNDDPNHQKTNPKNKRPLKSQVKVEIERPAAIQVEIKPSISTKKIEKELPPLSRQSTRRRVPNKRFDYILPGLIQPTKIVPEQAAVLPIKAPLKQSAVIPVKDPLRQAAVLPMKNPSRHAVMLVVNKEKIGGQKAVVNGNSSVLNKEATRKQSPKTDSQVVMRHSKRQHIPSKRYSFVQNIVANARKSRSKRARLTSVMQATSRGHRKPTISVFPNITAQGSSSRTDRAANPLVTHDKEYVSRNDVRMLVDEVRSALLDQRIRSKASVDLLGEKISSHFRGVQNENNRLRNSLRQLRAEMNDLRKNATASKCVDLMQQINDLREQKVRAEIKNDIQNTELNSQAVLIAQLEMTNKKLLNERESLQSSILAVGGTAGDIHRSGKLLAELGDGDPNESGKDENSMNYRVNWGNDSWMLDC